MRFRRWLSPRQGSVPCVVASVKTTTDPAAIAGWYACSVAVSNRFIAGGHAKLLLWLPRTTQKPPSPS